MSPHLNNFAKLIRGSLLGQLLLMAALPLMARLYTPNDFGFAQAIFSIATVLLIIGALRLEVAVLTESEKDLEDLIRCAFWVSVLTATTVLSIAIILVVFNTTWTKKECLALLVLPLLGFFACCNQLMTSLCLRHHAFEVYSRAKIIQPFGYAAGSLGLGILHASSASLLLADTFGRATSTAYIARKIGIKLFCMTPPGNQLLRKVLYKHRHLVSIGLISALINVAGSSFTSLMLLGLFGTFEAGQFAIVERTIVMPLGLIAGATSQIFIANLSKSIFNKNFYGARADFLGILRIQALTGVPIALLIFLVAPEFLNIFLGKGWEAAGLYVKALTPLLLASYIASPLNMTLVMLGRQYLQLLWDCIRLAIFILIWGIIWVNNFDPETAIWLHSCSAFILYSAFVMLAYWAVCQTPQINNLPS
jgi:O-antigen/teichoic acid export membrane protein